MRLLVFLFARAIVYATLFIGFLLVFLPARVVTWSGIPPPGRVGVVQVFGVVLAATGALLAVACILTFVVIGRGTPAPFDPPRELVIRGPYGMMRNPMYLGAGAALVGAALYYQSVPLAMYAAVFLVAMHLFVRIYEEPVLRRNFGSEYEEYCRRVGRWWPHGVLRTAPPK